MYNLFFQLLFIYIWQIWQYNAQIYHCHQIMIVVNLFKISLWYFSIYKNSLNNYLTFINNNCFNVTIMFSSNKFFLKTHNMAWNIQIAEICSVIFDFNAQFAFKAAHMNAFIFIFFLVQQSHWFKKLALFISNALCISSHV